MKLLFVWDSDYPWDIRVEKICRTLIERGDEVHLVCRNKQRRPTEEIHEGIRLHRLPCLPRAAGGLNAAYTFPAFFSPLWLSRINEIARRERVDAILVRDLPLALAAVLVGRLNRVPVILDMAECYPELIRLIWRFEPLKLRNVLIRNPFLADLVERVATRSADHIFVMIEESKNRLMRKGIPGRKLTIVSNTPDENRFLDAQRSFPGLLREQQGRLVLLYTGFLNHSRGLDTVISSLPACLASGHDFFLLLIGTGNAEPALRKQVEKLSLERHVGFAGWIDNTDIPEYVASADICLVPHHKCSHWDNTIPNKLFDYMAAGRAVLVSDADPMKRIVHETNCGLVYRDYDRENFASCLALLRDEQFRRRLGRNGVTAVREYYNWDRDSRALLGSLDLCVNG